MAANGMTTAEANATLDARIETNSTVDLVTTMGTASAAPTKVTGGSYSAQTPAWSSASGASKSNSGTVTWSGMPSCTITGTDTAHASAGARSWFAPYATSHVIGSGDSVITTATNQAYTFTNGT